jgi:hypothetical protein
MFRTEVSAGGTPPGAAEKSEQEQAGPLGGLTALPAIISNAYYMVNYI